MDILCCRNLLIYVNVETQKLALMHYAEPGGDLVRLRYRGLGHLFAIEQMKVSSARVPKRARNAGGVRHESAPQQKKPKTGHGHFLRGPAGALDFRPSSVVVTVEGDIIYAD
jgi:hypothetical protein